MRKKPLALILCSCVFLLFPIQLLEEILEGWTPSSVDWVLSVFFPILLTFGLLRVEKMAWYTLFGFIFLWGIKDYQGLETEQASLWSVLTHIIVYLLGVSYFINPRIKRLYFDPKLQWWRTKKRYETHGPAIMVVGAKTFYPQLKNISEGGCFLETPHTSDMFEKLSLTIPLPIPLRAPCLNFTGEVRWVSESSGSPGMGIQFQNISKQERQILKEFLRSH